MQANDSLLELGNWILEILTILGLRRITCLWLSVESPASDSTLDAERLVSRSREGIRTAEIWILSSNQARRRKNSTRMSSSALPCQMRS